MLASVAVQPYLKQPYSKTQILMYREWIAKQVRTWDGRILEIAAEAGLHTTTGLAIISVPGPILDITKHFKHWASENPKNILFCDIPEHDAKATCFAWNTWDVHFHAGRTVSIVGCCYRLQLSHRHLHTRRGAARPEKTQKSES
jgi:hypothetical protein